MNKPQNFVQLSTDDIDVIDLPNRPLNEAHIESLIAVGEFDSWEPIDVVEDGEEPGRYWLLHGQHRLTAAERAGRPTIKARILTDSFNVNQVITERFNDNLKNGLPPSTAERKEHADWLKQHFPQMTNAAISKRVGLSEGTLSLHFNGIDRSVKARTAEQEARAFARMIERVNQAGNGWFGRKHHKKHLLAELEFNPDLVQAFRVVGEALLDAADEFEESAE